MADSHAGAGELSELAYYYPEPFWLAQESSWIKSLLLFFDGVAILLPNYMKGRELVEDPSLAGPLTDRGLLKVLEPEWFVDEPLSTRLAEGMVELLLANARWPAAFESAYFAREETAKSANMFAAAYIVAEDAAQLNWPEFWNMWKDHKKKSAIFVMMSRLYERLFESTASDAAASTDADSNAEKHEAYELRMEREAALYVHWDGGIRTPWDSITERRAREMVAEARKMVDAEVASTDAHRANIDAAGRKISRADA